MAELVIWSASSGSWVPCPQDEITWLDRTLLSRGQDQTLHRSPRCPGLRHVHHRWELFSRDTSHPVYVAPFVAGKAQDYRAVQAGARHVLPVARGSLEPQPARLEAGAWLIGVGAWVLPACVNVAPGEPDPADASPAGDLPVTFEIEWSAERPAGQTAPAPDAMPKVARYFQRNPVACLAMAFYYQDFIRGVPAPQPRPMDRVAVALDLNRGAVSEYKKELQRRIWNEQGHQRELGEFLLVNGLIGQAELRQALAAAKANEDSGRSELARQRLGYSQK